MYIPAYIFHYLIFKLSLFKFDYICYLIFDYRFMLHESCIVFFIRFLNFPLIFLKTK